MAFLIVVISWLQRQQHSAIVQSLLKSLQLERFAVGKTGLSRRCSTRSNGAIDHWLNLRQNIPLNPMCKLAWRPITSRFKWVTARCLVWGNLINCRFVWACASLLCKKETMTGFAILQNFAMLSSQDYPFLTILAQLFYSIHICSHLPK